MPTILLTGHIGFTLDGLRAAAFDSYLPAFRALLPGLFAAYDALPKDDPRRAGLAEPIALLRGWDYRWGLDSRATSLAVFWGDTLWRDVGSFAQAERMNVPDYIEKRVSPAAKLDALAAAVDRLGRDFGDWRTPGDRSTACSGSTMRSCRISTMPRRSIPVAFASAQWGSLASFGAKAWPGTKRYYGTSGNSFVAVVEFGPRVRAMAVTAGGESGDPRSPHFADQAERYATGNLRPVYFYPDELAGHVERWYRPGE